MTNDQNERAITAMHRMNDFLDAMDDRMAHMERSIARIMLLVDELYHAAQKDQPTPQPDTQPN